MKSGPNSNSEISQRVAELASELIKFQTTRHRPDEIEKCLEFIEGYFDEGFAVRRFEKNGKPSLVISLEKIREPKILLHSHIDVVEAEEDMFLPQIEDGCLYGRGSADMKAGVACLMKAMKDLRELEDQPSVALMITSDEERGGFNGAG
ncbi:MAG: M20/M25/M40 family metallo-hydrolase, partial [Candidatus Aenigmatarchaeota archaeon]